MPGASSATSRNFFKELFVFVAEPDVPADNNPAERSLRPSGYQPQGQRRHPVEQGTERKMTLASLFGTWRAQGLNPLRRLPSAARFPLL